MSFTAVLGQWMSWPQWALSEIKSMKQQASKLQHEKDELLIRLDEANEKLGALNSECADKAKKIESMKQQT